MLFDMLRFTETVMDEINEFTITLLTLTCITSDRMVEISDLTQKIWQQLELYTVRTDEIQNPYPSHISLPPNFWTNSPQRHLWSLPCVAQALLQAWLLLVYFMVWHWQVTVWCDDLSSCYQVSTVGLLSAFIVTKTFSPFYIWFRFNTLNLKNECVASGAHVHQQNDTG